MAHYPRIIARLDIKGPNLVKGIHLEGLRVLGKPEKFAKYYYEEGADELIYMDVVASLYGRNSLTEIIEKTSREIFIPLCVGGGLRTLEDIRSVLNAGADKVSMNTAVINDPDFISRASNKFGSSTIVVSIEAIKKSDGTYEAYTENGREKTGVDVFDWAKKVAELGAGEIVLTAIHQEGTGNGFDVDLVKRIAESVPIPVIASGGAGKVEDVNEVMTEGAADAVALASLLHYECIQNEQEDDDYSDEGNVEYLRSRRTFASIRPARIQDIKQSLREVSIDCRV